MTTTRTVRLVDPVAVGSEEPLLRLAPRPATLRGKRLGLLNNSKTNSEPILRAIARILDEEFGLAEVFHLTKHSASLPPKPEIVEELHRRADIVVTGVGD